MRRLALWGLPFALLAAVAPAMGEEEDSGATYGRVRFLDAPLTIEQSSEGEVVEGTVNSPVVAGDRVATTRGRAEIELADSSVVWLDGDTRMEFLSLADVQNQYERTNLLALTQGSIRVESRDPGDPDDVFQIDTEAGSIYLLSAGLFRIDAGAGSTTVSSYGGVAEFSGDDGSVLIRSGQRSSVQNGQSPSNPRRFNTQREDDFDQFCGERAEAYLRQGQDEDLDQGLPQEIRPYASELSFYGTWRTIPTYGLVWRPHYAGVWTPYHHGYWTWCRHSWVWVSYDPWGWAPYHYGRWDHAADIGWFWSPGVVWSGAWVSFAVGPSYIGWCPLNYWNVPVFHDVWIVNRPTVNVARLDSRSWRFVPAGRFGQRGPDTVVLRGERLPRNTDLVVTQRLPQFDPRVVAKRPESASGLVDAARRSRIAPPVSQVSGGALTPFRALERRAPRGPIGHPDVARPKTYRSPGQPLPKGVPRGRSYSGTTSNAPSASLPPRPSQHGKAGQGSGARRGPQPDREAEVKPPPPATSGSQPARQPEPVRGRPMERLFQGTRTKTPPPSAVPRSPEAGPSPTSDPPKSSEPPPPSNTHRTGAPPRRTPPKKPTPPNPPPQDDSPDPEAKRH